MMQNPTPVSLQWTCVCGKVGRLQYAQTEDAARNQARSLGDQHRNLSKGGPAVHVVTLLVNGAAENMAGDKQAMNGHAAPVTVPRIGPLQAAGKAAPLTATVNTQTPILIETAEEEPEIVPPYVAQGTEVEDLTAAIEHAMNSVATGPTGCGKTNLVQDVVVTKLKRRLTSVNCSDGATYEDLVGYRTIDGGQVAWVDGLITAAMRRGDVLYMDEPNALPDGIRFILFSAMDHRRSITLPQNAGEVVHAAEGFTVVASMNEGAGYGGTTMLNQAFRGRFDVVIDLDYLPDTREAKVLVERTGVEKKVAKQMVEVAGKLRTAFRGRTVRTPVSTRGLLAWARLCASGYDPIRAATLTIVGQVPGTDLNERKAFQEAVQAVMGKGIVKDADKTDEA